MYAITRVIPIVPPPDLVLFSSEAQYTLSAHKLTAQIIPILYPQLCETAENLNHPLPLSSLPLALQRFLVLNPAVAVYLIKKIR